MTKSIHQNEMIHRILTQLQTEDPWKADIMEQLCTTCFMYGQQVEMQEQRRELAQMLNDTIPDNADPSKSAPFKTEVL